MSFNFHLVLHLDLFSCETFISVFTGTLGVRNWINCPLRMCKDSITSLFQVMKDLS